MADTIVKASVRTAVDDMNVGGDVSDTLDAEDVRAELNEMNTATEE